MQDGVGVGDVVADGEGVRRKFEMRRGLNRIHTIGCKEKYFMKWLLTPPDYYGMRV